jgi:hypothetical protein
LNAGAYRNYFLTALATPAMERKAALAQQTLTQLLSLLEKVTKSVGWMIA